MARSAYLAVLVGGVALLVFGIGSARSLGSAFSHFFTGHPTDRAMWMLAGGAALCAVGLMGVGRESK